MSAGSKYRNQALRTISPATAENRFDVGIGEQCVEFCCTVGVSPCQIALLVEHAGRILHAETECLKHFDTFKKCLTVNGAGGGRQTDTIPFLQCRRTKQACWMHLGSFFLCWGGREILCDHGERMFGDARLNGVAVSVELLFLGVDTGWCEQRETGGAEWLG